MTRLALATLSLGLCCLASAFAPAPFLSRSLRLSLAPLLMGDEQDIDSVLENVSTVIPGEHKKHEAKEGENEYQGGNRFRQLLEMKAAAERGELRGGTVNRPPRKEPAVERAVEAASAAADGWTGAVDPNTGQTYYYNAKGETSWTVPKAVAAEEPAAATADEWNSAVDPSSGKTYYYNAAGETSW
eukprot:CAMPEP_0113298180 /NCGR_PEP_ID=MMETSP0010_2-20120614/734_1 /TAXON_ID=216773 ORGANISM="Corethron hystrix, Strain 308" /NCGR_SAMPLE_ID=MMETSP0010_2 /ASSEMBLY_ACC=CAM_ASM_000155 /LENGTH=185 /DNA_ID=CAMNT_0000151195 /DNA_START=949 /DNA_END=1503 /DNA_ORIENTATION=+ /assembly_acc=CAM_ASM_000155